MESVEEDIGCSPRGVHLLKSCPLSFKTLLFVGASAVVFHKPARHKLLRLGYCIAFYIDRIQGFLKMLSSVFCPKPSRISISNAVK